MNTHISRPTLTILIVLMSGFVLFFTTQLILHYYSFGSRALDLGNMDQSIWNTLQGRPFHQTNQPGAYNRLSLHVEPIFLPISLLYFIYSGPEILFLFQTIIVALGAIPVFALARLKLQNEALALLFALIYLMFPAIQGATLLDFHAVTLAPTFLLAAFYYLETRQSSRFAVAAGLAVACKEDMTLLVMMLGIYAFVINRQYRWGTVTVALCLVWAFFAVFVIPPTFASTQNIHWNRYDHLGASPVDIVLNFIIRPHLFLDHLRAVDALGYFRQLLTPTAFTALLNPITLLLALPSFGINLLSNFPPMQRVNSLIYAAPTVPAVMISSIYGVACLQAWLVLLGKKLSVARNQSSELNLQLPITLLLALPLLLASVIYHYNFGYLPGGGQFRGWEEVTEHHRRASRIFAQIPPQAALSAQDRLNPHVSQRETLYIFDRVEEADHIVLDVTEDSWPLHPVELRHRIDQFLAGEFGVVDAYNGYLLLAKDQPDLPKSLPAEFFDFARVANPNTFSPQFPLEVIFADKIRLVGYDLELGAHEAALPVVTLYWQALQPLAHNYRLYPFFIDRNGHVIEDTNERPMVATLWYPPTAWSPEEIVITKTLPWDLGDEFTLAVGVTEDNWADPAQRLAVTHADPKLYTFENDTWLRLATFQRSGRKSYKRLPAPQPSAQPMQAQFWNIIDLQGVALPSEPLQAGQALPFTLQWQAQTPLTVNLTTFAHLLDAQSNVVAQLDWGPQDALGYLPTTAWDPNRPVVDHQTISLPADLKAGQYRLVVGWYYAVTGERLPLTAGGNGDTIQTGLVTVR